MAREIMDLLSSAEVNNYLLILICILTVLYCYVSYNRKFSFWTSRGVKQLPRPLPMFGHLLEMFLNPSHEIEMRRYKKMGRVYGMYDGYHPVLVVADPQLVKDILVKDFSKFPNRRFAPDVEPVFDNMITGVNGERWKTLRSAVSQTFTSGKMRKIAPLINECADSLIENLKREAERNQPIECRTLMGAFTMDVIASTLFATKIDTYNDPDNPFVKYGRQVFDQTLSLKFLVNFMFPGIFKALKLRFLNGEVVDFFCDITKKLIKERQGKKDVPNDFLQLMLDASELASKDNVNQDTEESENTLESVYEVDKGNSKVEVPATKKKPLTELEVLSQSFLFFVAGFETTANTLAFCLYHLAKENQDYQDRLIQEIDHTYVENGEINYDTLAKMPYLNAFVSEVLRMSNPGIRTERVSEEEYRLGDTGIVIPKGTVIAIPMYVLHHEEEWFPEPEKFDPERFMPENKDNIVPYSYIPFGAGPRNCVALRFALMQTKLCLAKILRHLRFVSTPETMKPLEYHNGTQLLQPKKIIVKVEKRRL